MDPNIQNLTCPMTYTIMPKDKTLTYGMVDPNMHCEPLVEGERNCSAHTVQPLCSEKSRGRRQRERRRLRCRQRYRLDHYHCRSDQRHPHQGRRCCFSCVLKSTMYKFPSWLEPALFVVFCRTDFAKSASFVISVIVAELLRRIR